MGAGKYLSVFLLEYIPWYGVDIQAAKIAADGVLLSKIFRVFLRNKLQDMINVL